MRINLTWYEYGAEVCGVLVEYQIKIYEELSLFNSSRYVLKQRKYIAEQVWAIDVGLADGVEMSILKWKLKKL